MSDDPYYDPELENVITHDAPAPTKIDNVVRLAIQTIETERKKWLQAKVKGWAPSGNHRASGLGHPCDYFYWMEMHKADEASPIPSFVGGSFWLGNELERHIADHIQELLGSDWEVLHIVHSMKIDRGEGKRPLTGRLDRIVRHKPSGRSFVLEIKTTGRYHMDKLKSLESILACSEPWLRGYPYQVNAYVQSAFATGLVTDKDALIVFLGLPGADLNPVWLPWSELEKLSPEMGRKMAISEQAATQEDLEKLPNGGRIPYRASICTRCKHFVGCRPIRTGTNPEVFEDRTLNEILGAIAAFHGEDIPEKTKQLKKLEDQAKDMVRPAGAGTHFGLGGKMAVRMSGTGSTTKINPPTESCPEWETYQAAQLEADRLGAPWRETKPKALSVRFEVVPETDLGVPVVTVKRGQDGKPPIIQAAASQLPGGYDDGGFDLATSPARPPAPKVEIPAPVPRGPINLNQATRIWKLTSQAAEAAGADDPTAIKAALFRLLGGHGFEKVSEVDQSAFDAICNEISSEMFGDQSTLSL